MSVTSVMRGMIAAAAAVVAIAALPANATAQGFFEGFWGGEEETGGKRHAVAFSKQYTPGQIIVSFGDRRLYHITKPGVAMSYPIAVPREKSRWSGVTSVSMKRENPDWTPTAEMFAENPRLPPWVPGGHPMNPMGKRAMYLGASTYRIHGTDAPWTIGQAVSKGCIRMFNEDVQQLYPLVKVGTKVTVTWEKFNANGAVANSDEPPEADTPSNSDKPKVRKVKVSSTETIGLMGGGSDDSSDTPAKSDKILESETSDSADKDSDAPKAKPVKVSYAKADDDDSKSSDASDATPDLIPSSGPKKRYFAPYKKKTADTEKSAANDDLPPLSH